MTGLENLRAKTMLADKDGDFWYYDGVGGMYCMVEGGVPDGASSRLTTEYAARWAPFTPLMAADWGTALTVACDERDAAEKGLTTLTEVVNGVVDLLGKVMRGDYARPSGVDWVVREAHRRLTGGAPDGVYVRATAKPGDWLTLSGSDVANEQPSEPKDGDLFKDKAGDTWIVNDGLYYLVTFNGKRVGTFGLVASEEEIAKDKPLIKLVPESAR